MLQRIEQAGSILEAGARLECGSLLQDLPHLPRDHPLIPQGLAVALLVSRVHAAQHVAEKMPECIDVAALVSGRKAILLGSSESIGPEPIPLAGRRLSPELRDAEIDEVRAICSQHDIGGGDVPMDDAEMMQGFQCLADAFGGCEGLCMWQRPPRLDSLFDGLACYEVIYDDELVGHLVGCLDLGKACRSGA